MILEDFDCEADSMYHALSEANKTWKVAYLSTTKERMDYMRQLHRHGAFSLNQLAKICRLSKATASRMLVKNSGGGRFEPEALTTLMVIRKLILTNQPVQGNLVRQAVDAGMSVSAIARLTGIGYATLYRRINTQPEGAQAA